PTRRCRRRTTRCSYRSQVTNSLGNVTVTAQDPLGRPVSVTDAAMGVTSYTYGPFGELHTVTDPGGALTRTTRDAFGRVRQLDDPNRGTTATRSGSARPRRARRRSPSRISTNGCAAALPGYYF